MTRAGLLLVLLAACGPHEEAKPVENKPAEPVVHRGRPSGETDEEIKAQAEAFEARAQRGEVNWVTTEGHDLVTLAPGGKHSDPFPVPKFKHGDEIDGAWLAPDGTLFTVGYMITGKPGPDTGAIHRMLPGGKLERVFEVSEHELYGVWGRTVSDVYAVGADTVVHFDGKAWTAVAHDGIAGKPIAITGTAKDVWILASEGQDSRIYRRDGDRWKLEAEAACILRSIDAATAVVYAAGACDAVWRRAADGKWASEHVPVPGVFDIVAVSDDEAYTSGEELLHRKPGGKWGGVRTSLPRVFAVSHAGKTEIFAVGNVDGPGGKVAVLRGVDGKLARIDLDECDHVVGGDPVTYGVHQRWVSAPPPEDLRH